MSKSKERKTKMGYLNAKLSSVRSRLKNLFSEFGDKQPRVLILGLDGAGKTTLLYRAKLNNTMFASVPPHGMNIEAMTPRFGATMTVWDMKGSKLSRHRWANYYRHTEGVVYVVDSADIVRLDEAMYELDAMLETRDLRCVPVVVAATKQDVDGAMAVSEVSLGLGLDDMRDRDWRIHGVSGTSGLGVAAVFTDMVALLKTARQRRKADRKSVIDGSVDENTTFGYAEKSGVPPSNTGTMESGDSPSLFRNIKDKEKASDEESGVSSIAVTESDSNTGGADIDDSNDENDNAYDSLNETFTIGNEAAADSELSDDLTDSELSDDLGATLPEPDGEIPHFQMLPDAAINISELEQGPMSDINVFQREDTQSKV